MKQILRIDCFETNSSSTHSYIHISKESFEQWKLNQLVFDEYSDNLVDVSSNLDEILNYSDRYRTYKNYMSWASEVSSRGDGEGGDGYIDIQEKDGFISIEVLGYSG